MLGILALAVFFVWAVAVGARFARVNENINRLLTDSDRDGSVCDAADMAQTADDWGTDRREL